MSPSTSRGLSSSTDASRTPSPSKVLRITNNTQRKKGPGKLTSDLGKTKPKPPAPNPLSLAIEENRPLTDLEEIDSALQSITLSPRKRIPCGCFGTKHDVYPIAPNCLFCGRIYCVDEGLGKCFFCGEELVDDVSKEELVRELKLERGVAKTKAANEKVRKVKAGESRHRVWAAKVGGRDVVHTEEGSGGESDFAVGSGVATPSSFDQGYIDAERKRDELLEFDRTFAERTKIIGIVPPLAFSFAFVVGF
jgi:Putative zinc finger motif, C2HC5-type